MRRQRYLASVTMLALCALFVPGTHGQQAQYPAYVVDAQQPVVSSDGFNDPHGLVVLAGGTLLVSDTGNHRLLQVSPEGTQQTVSFGNLTPAVVSPAGLARDGSSNLYVTDVATNRLIKIPAAGGNALAILKAPLLNEPVAVAAGARGSLLVVNAGNHTVVLRYLGGLPGVLATGDTKLVNPRAVAFDAAEQIYVADGGDGVTPAAVYRFPRQGGTGVNLGLTGYALKQITGLTVDSGGNVYVLDGAEKQLIEIPVKGGLPYLVPQSNFNAPSGLAADNLDNLYVSDTGAGTVTKFTYHNAANFGRLKVGAVSEPVTFNFEFYQPLTVTATHTMGGGRLNAEYAPSAGGTCGLRKYEPVTSSTGVTLPAACTANFTLKPAFVWGRPGAVQLVTSIGTVQQLTYGVGLGAQLALLNAAVTTKLASEYVGEVAVNAANTEIYFTGYGPGIYRVPIGGNAPVQVTQINGQFALDGAGDLFVFDGVKKVTKVPADGSATSEIVMPELVNPVAMVIDQNDALYFTDLGSGIQGEFGPITGVVWRVSATGVISKILPGSWVTPTNMVADGSGNIYVEDDQARGIYEVVVGDGEFSPGCSDVLVGGYFGANPYGLGVDRSGALYFLNYSPSVDGLAASIPSGPHCGAIYQAPIYTIPGLRGYVDSYLPFQPEGGSGGTAGGADGKLYFANGNGKGVFLVNRTHGEILPGAFDLNFVFGGGSTQTGYVYNIGNEDAHFTDGTKAFTVSGTGAGTLTYGEYSGGCAAGSTIAAGDSCTFTVTDNNLPGSGPLVTDTLHFLTDAVNNDAVSFRVSGASSPAPK